MIADTIVVGGRVHTMGAGGHADETQIVAIAGGRVIGTGPRSAIDSYRGEGTRIVDAGGRTVIPGLVDPHAHGEVSSCVLSTTVDVRVPRCRTIADVQDTLREAAGQTNGEWLVGQANLFFDQKLADRRFPTRAELDAVSRDVPIAIRAGGHLTLLNSRALEVAGIDRSYKPPDETVTGRPVVERDSSGQPTGIVKEMDVLLPLPQPEGAGLHAALRDGMRHLFTRHGVTTVGEISNSREGLAAFDDLHCSGELGMRIFVYLWIPGTVTLDEACSWQQTLGLRADPALYTVQGVKMWADGGYSAASAAVKTDYVQRPGWRGQVALTDEEIRTVLGRATDANLQFAIHANGDRTQEEVCAAIEAAGGSPDGVIRTRLEHAGNFLPEPEVTMDAWRRAGIIPVPQPVFLYTFGDFFPVYLGQYGAQGRFPFRRLIDEGWVISGSSDIWVGGEDVQTNPFFGMWCCRMRETFLGDTIDRDDQLITVEEAMRMHTIDAAYLLGRDDELGSLEAGKRADVAIVDRDPFTTPDNELRDVKVDAVLLDGRVVYERDGAPAVQHAAV